MEAYISSIKYIKVNKFYGYFKVTLLDKDGSLMGYFGKENLSDPISFRKETFGILSSCNCFDLLKLGGEEITPLEITIEIHPIRDIVTSITNQSGVTLKNVEGNYVLNKNILHKFLNYKNEEKAQIENIISRSGVFEMILKGSPFYRFYTTGSVYYGFGYPLISFGEINEEDVLLTSTWYHSYITSILKFYKTDDLLTLNRKQPSIYRKVSILIDENNEIYALGNEETNMYLTIQDGKYEMIKEDLENIKKLKQEKNKKTFE